jgi:hypothetical protein
MDLIKDDLALALEIKKINRDRYNRQRMQELSLLTESKNAERYSIQIILEPGVPLLTEHETYTQFSRTNNFWRKDPEDLNIPVQAHYHIYGNRSSKEIYAVNIDGTAHHKKNRGFTVPKKEAEELRKFGVAIPDNRIIEIRDLELNVALEKNSFSITLVI